MFKVPRPSDSLFHVGHYITLRLKEQHKTVRQLAKQGGLSARWVYKLLKRKDWQVSYLMQFSEMLQEDLLRFFRPSFLPEQAPKAELDKALKENGELQLQLQQRDMRIAQQEQQVQLLQRDNQTLREVLGTNK